MAAFCGSVVFSFDDPDGDKTVTVPQNMLPLICSKCGYIQSALQFKAQIDGGEEKSESEEIHVPHIPFSSFKLFLRHCTDPDKTFLNEKHCLDDLVQLAIDADYLLMDELLVFVQNRMRRWVRETSVWRILNKVNRVARVAKVCDKLLQVHTMECLKVKHLREASVESFAYFLQLPFMSVASEEVLVRATLALSKFHSFDKEWLKAALPHLRILTLKEPQVILQEFKMALRRPEELALRRHIESNGGDGSLRRQCEGAGRLCLIAERRMPEFGFAEIKWRNDKRPASVRMSFEKLLFECQATVAITGLVVALPSTFTCECKHNCLHKSTCDVHNYVMGQVVVESEHLGNNILVCDRDYSIRKNGDAKAVISFGDSVESLIAGPDVCLHVVIPHEKVRKEHKYTPVLLEDKVFPLRRVTECADKISTTLNTIVKNGSHIIGLYYQARTQKH